jgi:signal transduction histidine kinase/ActR/RegA family two-component response regulator
VSDQDAVREREREIQRSSAPASLAEATMIRLDRGTVHVETTGMSVLFEGQQAILSVIRDVSSRREIVARTMQIDRMLAVGTLAAGVGHEINNPLAYVMTNVTYATDEVRRVQEQLEEASDGQPSMGALARTLAEVVGILGEIDDGTRRIRDIARDLNTFARNDEEQGLVDLRAAADSALRMAAHELRRRARVVRHYQDVPPVRASASRISQVFLNLVINAAHSISMGAHDSNEISVRIRSENGSVVAEVSDTGSGIAPEHRERLFTPFFTTKPIGQGTGLGLSISRRIVRSLGGDIAAESVPGQGTTMRVTLPAAPEAMSQSESELAAPARRLRLLFIDDERLLGTAFQRTFSRAHDVVVVETGAAALSLLAAGESFDVVFCDVNMPRMTGVAFYESVERSLPMLASRVVLITGGGDRGRAKDFTEKRNVPLLEKPLDMRQVQAILDAVVSPAKTGG